jgi:hypothetical protein
MPSGTPVDKPLVDGKEIVGVDAEALARAR